LSKAIEKELQKTGIHVFYNHMKQRVLYAEVIRVGKTVMEVEPEGTAAIDLSPPRRNATMQRFRMGGR
jgi:hypothetical protein